MMTSAFLSSEADNAPSGLRGFRRIIILLDLPDSMTAWYVKFNPGGGRAIRGKGWGTWLLGIGDIEVDRSVEGNQDTRMSVQVMEQIKR
jgi:hypothetical protein